MVEAKSASRSRLVVSGICINCRIRRLPSNGTAVARKIRIRAKSQCITGDENIFAALGQAARRISSRFQTLAFVGTFSLGFPELTPGDASPIVLDSSRSTKMKILVIGGGGREHAIVWKLAQSASVEEIWCAPGNDGIANEAECVPLDLKDVKAAADLAEKLSADLTIVGPELPLVLGIADEFAKRKLTLLGPAQTAAQLEGSKIFSKRFMERHGIPTAAVYGICDSPMDAYPALDSVDWPLVIKADGLCAG